ncbi:MAG: asparagine synthase (glutamine-hydrolyzing) [Bacteroidota bacterium]
MCGITGFVDNTHSLNEINLKDASATLQHRGGNGSGVVFEQNNHFTIALANQQLTTIDKNGKVIQPITSNCGFYSVTLNGTIYNYIELREMLIKYGIIFKTLTDSEVLLECYKKWGQKMFEKIDGSYSFALFDRKFNQLLIARDSIGTKPLFYYKIKGFYAFASEIKALLNYPNIDKKINRNAISTYFRYGYFIGNDTIYQEIYQFKKGTLTVIDLHSGNSYDTPILASSKNNEEEPSNDENQVIERVEELLTESILKRNVADVPSGVLLSSGYDSATLAAILQKNQSKRIKTFTVGFENSKFDEAPKAKKIAEHLKTNHKEFYFNQKQACEILEKLPAIFEEPIGDSGALPFLFIAKNVHHEVKVLLGAEGGDVLFGGYRSYKKALALNALPHQIPSYLKGVFNMALNYASAKTQEVIKESHLLSKYQSISACFTHQEIEKLLNHANYFTIREKKGEKTLKDLLEYDFENTLPNNLLYKGDKCLMYYGIDNRDTFLKADLVSYLSKLDDHWFIRNGKNKYLLRQITHKYVPETLMDETKRGFTIPLPSWLKTCFKPYIESYLNADQLNKHRLLNVAEVLKIKAAFYRNSSINNAKKIWLLLQFQMWYEEWG